MLMRIISIAVFSAFVSIGAYAAPANSLVLSETKSVLGRDLILYRFSNPQSTNKFYVQAGLHGNEDLPVAFARWLVQRVRSGKSYLYKEFHKDFSIDILPVANPDGYAANSRFNARGVNLNRNFGVLFGSSKEWMGTSAFSEPETKFIQKALAQGRYTSTADIHGYIDWVVGPSEPQVVYKSGRMSSLRTRESYRSWISILKQTVSMLGRTYKFRSAGDLGDGGAFEDYAFWKTGAFAFCLEMHPSFRAGATEADFIRVEHYLVKVFKAAASIRKPNLSELAEANSEGFPGAIQISH